MFKKNNKGKEKGIIDHILDHKYEYYLKRREHPNAIFMNRENIKEIYSLNVLINGAIYNIMVCYDDYLRNGDMIPCVLSAEEIITEKEKVDNILKELSVEAHINIFGQGGIVEKMIKGRI